MRISVIIPALNEQNRIGHAVESAWSSGVDEVVVCDGGSTDRTLDVLNGLNCKVTQSQAGRALQQNAGARVADGDVFVFQHADNRLASSSAEQIRRCLGGRPELACGAFRQRIEHRSWCYRLLEWGNAARVKWRGMAYGDQAIFVRRDVFWQVGGFAEVPLLEDVILMRQLRRIARPVLLDGRLRVDSRRWERHGVIAQTFRNWFILSAFALGVTPDRLAKLYRRHDHADRRG